MPSHPYNGQLDAFELYHKISEDDVGGGVGADGLGLPALGHALAGSAGTAISHLILYPLDLTITRLQAQRQLRSPSEAPSAAQEADLEYKSLQDAAHKIYKNEGGLQAFYAGCLTDTSKSIVDSFLFFLAYSFLRQQRRKAQGARSLPVLEELGVGIVAGAFAKLITTPIQQIVTRKQTAALVAARDPTSSLPSSETSNLSIKDIALQIRSERGLSGFWAGYSASLILTLNPALTFLIHNLLTQTFLPRSKRDNPGSQLTFLIAALSKAAASTVTYPFSLAKTRAQVSSSSSGGTKTDNNSPFSSDSPPEYLEKSNLDDTSRPVPRAAKASQQLLRALTSRIGQPAVIRSLRQIYANEGVTALYSGLEAEVLKGFLGHGLTMLLKERIHVGIVHSYFALLQALKKWPENANPGAVGEQAKKEVSRVMGIASRGAQEAGEKAGNVATTVGAGVKDAFTPGASVQQVGEKVQNVATTVGEGLKNAVTPGAEGVGDRLGNVTTTVSEGVKGAVPSGAQDVGERAQNVATTVGEGVKSAVPQGAQEKIQNMATTVGEGVKSSIPSGAGYVGERAQNVTTTVGEGVKNAVNPGAQEVGQRVENVAVTVGEGVKGAIKSDKE